MYNYKLLLNDLQRKTQSYYDKAFNSHHLQEVWTQEFGFTEVNVRDRYISKTLTQFLTMWKDLEGNFANLINVSGIRQSSGIFGGRLGNIINSRRSDTQNNSDRANNTKVRDVCFIVHEYCKVEAKVLEEIDQKLNLVSATWLNRQQKLVKEVNPLSIWQYPAVCYEIFVKSYFRNSIRGFLQDEVMFESKL